MYIDFDLQRVRSLIFPKMQRFDGFNIEYEGINDFLKLRNLQFDLIQIPNSVNENMLIFDLILYGIMFSSILFRFVVNVSIEFDKGIDFAICFHFVFLGSSHDSI